MNFDSIIVRFAGEMGIKGKWTRRFYEKLLYKNIKRALKNHEIPFDQIIRKQGRIYIKTKRTRDTANYITKIFGVSSISPAIETTSEINTITKNCVEVTNLLLKDSITFAIRCHRIGKHSYSSMEVNKIVGKTILDHFKNRNLQVNLKNPQFVLNIEIKEDLAFIYIETFQGVGGFPLGSQPKLVCLLSGGIDSAVACWLAMKRGSPLVFVFFDTTPLTGSITIEKALDVAKKLFEWSIGYSRKIYIVPYGKTLKMLIKDGPKKLTCILCKRIMYRIAEKIAEIEKAEGIVTGEAIGEQASQTLTNLRVLTEAVTNYPVHRPILCFDKIETEQLAKKIGTFDISTRKSQSCPAAPKKPSVKAKLEVVKKFEKRLDMNQIIKESIKDTKILLL